jgi:hypothetical protein
MPIIPASDFAAIHALRRRGRGRGGIFPLRAESWTPYSLPNLLARYSLAGAAGDASFLMDGSNRLRLVADRSGNSAENCLVLNRVSGNYASAPDSAALSITGDIDIRVKLAATDWTPGSTLALVSKRAASGNVSYSLRLDTGGSLSLAWSANGTTLVVTNSTANPVIADGAVLWVRAWLDVDDGGVYRVRYLTSSDGILWTQLGADVVGAATTSIFDGTALVEIGSTVGGTAQVFSGAVYRAQIYNGINGTLVFDADFTLPAKLAGSFTESSVNAATVTINSSGDLGARICGARDLYQGTTGKQQIVSTEAGRNLATTDNFNDYIKSAPRSQAQPVTRYTVFRAGSWTSGDVLWDGFTASSAKLSQTGTTPAVQLNAGSDGPTLSTFTLGEFAVCAEVISGAASTLGHNIDARTAAANAGSSALGGTTIGTDGAGNNASDLAWQERLEFSAAHDAATQLRVAEFLLKQWGHAA